MDLIDGPPRVISPELFNLYIRQLVKLQPSLYSHSLEWLNNN